MNMNIVSFHHQVGKSTALFILIAVIAITVGVVAQNKLRSGLPLPTFDNLILLPKTKPLGDIKFTKHDGTTFEAEDLAGKWSILFFAFTNCPDICPSTLHVLKQVKQELTANGTWQAFQLTMVSVDPERDTPERLQQYVPFFDPEFIGLTADLDYTTQFAKNLGILFFKGDVLENGGYDVDHSAALILVNPDGQFAGVINAPHKKETLISDLQKLGNYALSQGTINTDKKSKTPDNTDASSESAATDSAQTNATHADLVFKDAWIRPAPPTAPSMAGYLTIKNNSHRNITIVEADSPLFDAAMIHQTVIEGGVAKMQHMDGLTIAAGESADLTPLGVHLMLMRPEDEVSIGTQVPVQFTLDSGETIDLSIKVQDNPSE